MSNNKLKIWIISDSEPIPQLTGNGRLMRAGQLAELFEEEDCDVTWYASTWLHYEEKFYTDRCEKIKLKDNLSLILLHAGKAYKKHVSLQRILYCKRIEREFKKELESASKPDLIVCSWPLIELGYQAVVYGKKNNIPVVLDIRDLWPDIFTQPFRGLTKKLAGVAIKLMYGYQTKFSFKNATQVIGVTDDAVKMAYGWGRKKTEKDAIIFLSKRKNNKQPDQKNFGFLKEFGIAEDAFLAIYVGSIHFRNAQLDTIIETAELFKGTNVVFVLCGKGPDFEKIKEITRNNTNIKLVGYRNAGELDALSSISKIGILPYSNTPDFINALPNKLSEYLSQKLIAFTTLKGASKALIEEYECGEFYETPDQLVEKINRYVNDDELVLKTKENSLRLYNEFFNADITYRNFCKSWINALKSEKRGY